MVELPSGSRRGSGGKLTAVLDHRLRIGDQEDSESVVAAYKARGLTPPEHLTDPPQIQLRFLVYWEAFQDLQTERVHPRATIPIIAIIDYAGRYGLDPDTLKRIVWKLDRVLLEYWRGMDESEKAQQKAQADQRPGVGGRS